MDSQWLHIQFRLNPDKTKADLARMLGLEPPAISKILSGTRQIKAQEYIKMREFFGMGGTSYPLSGGVASMRGRSVVSGDRNSKLRERDVENGDWVIGGTVFAHVGRPLTLDEPFPDKIRIFPIRERLMEPELQEGDHVIVDLKDKNPAHAGLFVISDGFGYMARHCVLKKEIGVGTRIAISARCGNFEPQYVGTDEVIVMGRVIGKIVGI